MSTGKQRIVIQIPRLKNGGRMAMKKVTALFLVIIISLLSSCSYITGETLKPASTPASTANLTKTPVYVTIPGPNGPRVIDVSQIPILITVSAAPAFLPGERIIFGIGISNLSSSTITIDPFPAAMRIKSLDRNEIVYSEPAGKRTYDISADRPFTPNKDNWDQKDDNGQQVSPGAYELSYEYVIIDRSTSKKYTENPSVRFKIADPASAMMKDISVNQTITSGGLAATLERLEINAVSGTAYVFYNPPGLIVPQGPNPDPNLVMGMDKFFKGDAEYSIDGGEIKQLKNNGGEGNQGGITLYFKNIEVVPLGAKEFILTVTNLGGIEGRWEFKIPLE
jgi:hypothetical protein